MEWKWTVTQASLEYQIQQEMVELLLEDIPQTITGNMPVLRLMS